MNIRVVIADGQPLFLDGLELLLQAEGKFTVAQCCASGLAALRAIEGKCPDVVVCDIAMPGMGGIDLLREVRRLRLPTRIVLLTASISEAQLLDAMRLDVDGVVLKDMPKRMILQCLQKVDEGGRWVESRAMQSALESAIRREESLQDVARELTPREIDTVRMVAQGLRNKAIARHLDITEGTVKTHVRNVYKKLGLSSRIAVRCYAETRRIV
jgi:two-component system, NarL family, nitrate/nitrite response regulator NarL